MLKKYAAHLFILLLTLCALPTRDALAAGASSEQETAQSEEKVTVRGLQLLEEIKETIDSAIKKDHPSESAEILWPCSKLYYTTAQQKLAQLYADLHNSRSPAAENCLAYIEDYLEQLARFSTKKLHRNDPKIHEFTNNTLTNLVNVAEETQSDTAKALSNPDQHMELNPLDKKIQEKALQFVRFTRLMFLPPVAITSTEPSWIETIKDKAANALEEHPFMCGVVTTMVAIALYITYKKLTAPEPPAGKKNTKKPTASAGSKGSLEVRDAENEARLREQEYAANRILDERTQANETEYEVIPVPVATQGHNTCAYHSMANAAAVTIALEKKRKEKTALTEEETRTLETALLALRTAEETKKTLQQEIDQHANTQSQLQEEEARQKTLKMRHAQSLHSSKERLAAVEKELSPRSWWMRLWSGTKEDEEKKLKEIMRKQGVGTLQAIWRRSKLHTQSILLAKQLAEKRASAATTTTASTEQLRAIQTIQEKISRTELTPAEIAAVLTTLGTTTSLPTRETIESERAAFIREQELKISTLTDSERKTQTELVQRLKARPDISEDEAVLFFEYLLKKASLHPETVSIGRNHSGGQLSATAPVSILRDGANPSTLTTVCDYAQNSMEHGMAKTYTEFESTTEEQQHAEIAALEKVIGKNLRYEGEEAHEGKLGVEDWDAMTTEGLSPDEINHTTDQPGLRISALRQGNELARQTGNPYPQILTQLQAGKTVIVGTRATEAFHWTSHVLVPDTVPPTKISAYHMDSNSPQTRSISASLKCLIHDALHLKLPSESSPAYNRLKNAFNCITIRNRTPEMIIPHMRNKVENGKQVRDSRGRVVREKFTPTTSAAPDAPATS